MWAVSGQPFRAVWAKPAECAQNTRRQPNTLGQLGPTIPGFGNAVELEDDSSFRGVEYSAVFTRNIKGNRICMIMEMEP